MMVERIREVQAQGAGAPAEHATDVRDKGVENADVDQVSDDREAVTAELGERHSEALVSGSRRSVSSMAGRHKRDAAL